jgi:hypothetical protein
MKNVWKTQQKLQINNATIIINDINRKHVINILFIYVKKSFFVMLY